MVYTALKSPIRRFGGKHLLRNWLSGMILEHAIYIEPFCGAGHLLFAKEPSKVEVLNDIDDHLTAFFKVMKDFEKRQRIIDILDCMPYSRSLWQELRAGWKQGNIPSDPVEASAQWFYLNRSCFGGDQKTGGFAMPSVKGRNPVQDFRNAIDGFTNVAWRLRHVCIENLPYSECIKRYDSQDTLFYCDPPYLNAEHYYGNTFSQDDHYKLAELLHESKGQIMVSHYADELYDELYASWHKYTYQSFKGASKAEPGAEKPKTVECVWANFKAGGVV